MEQSRDDVARNDGLSRRSLMKRGSLLVGAGLGAGATRVPSASAQQVAPQNPPPNRGATAASTATEPDTYGTDFNAGTGGATVPLRAPAGHLDFLDPNQYIHNMEIVAHIEGVSISAGEPQANMWAKGPQRLIVGGGGFLDVTDPTRPEVFNSDVYEGGFPNIVFNEQLKKWILITSVEAPRTVPSVEFPRGKYHPEYFEQARSYTGPRGIRTWDATDPANVQLLQEFNTGQTGSGTHMNAYDGGRYAYLDCGFDDTLRMENDGRPFSYALLMSTCPIRRMSRRCLDGGCRASGSVKRRSTSSIRSRAISARGRAFMAPLCCRRGSRTAARSAMPAGAISACTCTTSRTLRSRRSTAR